MVRKGRHHSARMTARVRTSCGTAYGRLLWPPSTKWKTVSTPRSKKRTYLYLREGPPFLSVQAERDRVGVGGTWRSYDGTFSNYSSIRLAAAGAFAFHAERRKNPSRFSRGPRTSCCAWLGMKATGGCCGCEGPPPRLIDVTTVCKVEDGEEIKLPKRCGG